MSSSKFTSNMKRVLRALCLRPWANDRQISETEKIKMSTVTACKNRLKRALIYKKTYLPAYHRLGYPLVSFSQLKDDRPPDAVLKALSKYQAVRVNENDKTLVSYMATDPFNTFVMSHHRDFTAFKAFENVFGQDMSWSHEVCTMEGATKVVDFNYTNIVNRQFFPDRSEAFRPMTMNTIPLNFHKIEKKVFDGLLDHQGEVLNTVASKIGLTRQTVVKMMGRFKKDGTLEKNTVVDLGRLGMQFQSIIKFKKNRTSNEEISKINRILGPFYYWVFDHVHVIMVANTDYKEMMTGLGQLNEVKGILDLKVQFFQVGTDGLSVS